MAEQHMVEECDEQYRNCRSTRVRMRKRPGTEARLQYGVKTYGVITGWRDVSKDTDPKDDDSSDFDYYTLHGDPSATLVVSGTVVQSGTHKSTDIPKYTCKPLLTQKESDGYQELRDAPRQLRAAGKATGAAPAGPEEKLSHRDRQAALAKRKRGREVVGAMKRELAALDASQAQEQKTLMTMAKKHEGLRVKIAELRAKHKQLQDGHAMATAGSTPAVTPPPAGAPAGMTSPSTPALQSVYPAVSGTAAPTTLTTATVAGMLTTVTPGLSQRDLTSAFQSAAAAATPEPAAATAHATATVDSTAEPFATAKDLDGDGVQELEDLF